MMADSDDEAVPTQRNVARHPMPDDDTERTFLARLHEHPADDELRGVYADWLDEHHRTDEADFLRVQKTLHAMSEDDPRFAELGARLRGLGEKVRLSWRRAVGREPIERCGVRFDLVCPKRWDALATTAAADVRFCATCGRDVHYAETIEAARLHAERGRCVAVDLTLPRAPDDLEPRPPLLLGAIMPFDDDPKG